MNTSEFFDRLYVLNSLGQDREIVAFAKEHAPGMRPRLTGEEQMRLHGLVEGSLMALDLEKHFGQSSEPDLVEVEAPSSANH